jgi:hypothetical protein
MTDTARSTAEASPPPSDLFLYTRPGCHLCDDARKLILDLLEERAARGIPTQRLVERDITTDPEWERAHFTTIPVLELGDRRLDLALSPAKVRRLLDGA